MDDSAGNRAIASSVKVVRPARFERATIRLEGGCSIQLSYGRMSMARPNRLLKAIAKPAETDIQITSAKARLTEEKRKRPACCQAGRSLKF